MNKLIKTEEKMKEKIRKLFSTPKKAVLTIAIVIAVLAAAGAGTAFAASAAAESSSIGAENAQNFAFADAEVDPVDAEDVSAKFRYEQGQFVYDVRFTYDSTQYIYWIKASDGSVVKKNLEIICDETDEIEDEAGETDTSEEESGLTADEEVSCITKSEAKDLALEDAGLDQSEISSCEIDMTTKNGIIVYDIEFETIDGTIEYEYIVNAVTGAIISKTSDADGSASAAETTAAEEETAVSSDNSSSAQSTSSSSSSELIGKSTAKSIALADAGVSSSELTDFDIKLDTDNGVKVYEIDFETADGDYEYEINAYNGAVISRDIDVKISSASSSDSSSSSIISLDEAKTIAVNHAGFGSTSDVTFSKAKLDTSGSTRVYKIEFISGSYEYEYVINASTGAIMEYECEYDD